MIDFQLSNKLLILRVLCGNAHHEPLTSQKLSRNIGTGICRRRLSQLLLFQTKALRFRNLLQLVQSMFFPEAVFSYSISFLKPRSKLSFNMIYEPLEEF